MSAFTKRACCYLAEYGETDAGTLGAVLWPNRRTRGSASQGGGDYAAQMLLGRLRKAGLVHVVHGEGSSRWAVTAAGVKHAHNK